MTLLILSYIAGVLTVAAPCILPLLPVIVGGTLTVSDRRSERTWFRPLVIAVSLAGSVVLFTLLLKATTALLGVPQSVWNFVSGTIILLFGINLLVPTLWEKFMVVTGLQVKANRLAGSAYRKRGLYRDVVLGASLGPVFSSCSPTYALIVAAVLPESFGRALIYLGAYAFGLASVLLLIAIAGQAVVGKLGWLSNSNGVFRRVLGGLFIVVGISVLFGLDRKFQAYVLEQGWYDPIMRLEQRLDL